VHGVPCRRFASARRNHQTTQGELKKEYAPAQVAERVRSACMNERIGLAAGTPEAGSDTLRAERKPDTLHCFRFDPISLEM